MAEEIASNPSSEKTEAVAPAAPAEKKKRAPRQKKAVANSLVASSAATERKLGRGRKAVAPAEVPQTEAKKRGGRRQKPETAVPAKADQLEAPVQVRRPLCRAVTRFRTYLSLRRKISVCAKRLRKSSVRKTTISVNASALNKLGSGDSKLSCWGVAEIPLEYPHRLMIRGGEEPRRADGGDPPGL